MADLIEIGTELFHSPCGDLLLGAVDGKLCLCDWLTDGQPGKATVRLMKRIKGVITESPSETTRRASAQLEEYFAGKRRSFDIPLSMSGTRFQEQVWHTLADIGYGTRISYATLADSIGQPTAVRAVANANGANPISIIIPCHRVIGSDGSLTGYGGGMSRKRFLLALETNNSGLFQDTPSNSISKIKVDPPGIPD